MPNGMYGGVRGKETKVGQKTFVSRPTRLDPDRQLSLPGTRHDKISLRSGFQHIP